jgi:hypothetical protein
MRAESVPKRAAVAIGAIGAVRRGAGPQIAIDTGAGLR